MAVITYSRSITRKRLEIEAEPILCPFCANAMKLRNIFSKKHKRDFNYGRFEGSIAVCETCLQDGEKLTYFSYDIDSVRAKVLRHDTSKNPLFKP